MGVEEGWQTRRYVWHVKSLQRRSHIGLWGICSYAPCWPPRAGSLEDLDHEANGYTEVDRAIDNLVKSGKMFGMSGRRDSMPMSGAARSFPDQFGNAIPSSPST